MSYQLTVESHPTHLHIVVTGTNSVENVTNYLEDVLRECNARKCHYVLLEERLEGPRLGMMDVFNIVSKGSTKSRLVMNSIAYVDINASHTGFMRFAHNLANAMGMPMRLFETVEEAREWLVKRSAEEAEQRAQRGKN